MIPTTSHQPPTTAHRRHDGPDMRNEVRPTVPHTAAEAEVTALHDLFETRTGFELTLNYDRIRMWNEWRTFARFTAEDLKLVIAYLKANIARGDRNEGALKFSNLIGNAPGFEEDLGLARKWRNRGGPRNGRNPSASAPQSSSSPAAAAPDDRTPEQRAADWRARLEEEKRSGGEEETQTKNQEPGTRN